MMLQKDWNEDITYPDRPQPPNISKELTHEIFVEMIHACERDRIKWNLYKDQEITKLELSRRKRK